jgi:tRNA-dihydrouridine synthase
MKDTYGIDGIMIGRASIGNPWVFNEIKHYLNTGEKLAPASMPQRIEAARRHLEMAIEWKGEKLGIFETRRHYANYFKGFPHFKEIRMALVTLETQEDLFGLLNKVKLDYSERELVQ